MEKVEYVMDNSLIQTAYFASGSNGFAVHYHNCHEILYIRRGKSHISCSGKDYFVGEKSVFFISNLEQHSVEPLTDDYERYCIQVSPVSVRYAIKNSTICSIFSNRPEFFNHLIDVSDIAEDIEWVFKCLAREYSESGLFVDEMQKSLLRILLIRLYRFSPKSFPMKATVKNTIVEDIQKEFENNYSAFYSLDILAKKHHVSKSYLSHLFKEITGYGVMEYLSEHRLSIAKDMLCSTSLSASKIAEETGFSTGGNFSRYLKNDTGLTPREYRNAHSKENNGLNEF